MGEVKRFLIFHFLEASGYYPLLLPLIKVHTTGSHTAHVCHPISCWLRNRFVLCLPLALYLRQIRFVVQRILFLQKFCSLDNFLCTLTFSNQERLFFADVLFFFKFFNLCTFEREERMKMEEKVKYAFLGGIVVLLTKLIFNFFRRGFSNASFER